MVVSKESKSISSVRDFITLFVIIFISGVGYPLFQYTTSIYRANLPTITQKDINFEIPIRNDPEELNKQIEKQYGIKFWKFKQEENGEVIDSLDKFESELNSYGKSFNNYLPFDNYNIVISLLVENGIPLNWEIDQAIKESFTPFLSLFPNQNFSITTNINYFSKLNKQYENGIIKENELTTFINFNDWNINQNNVEHTINFLIYLPKNQLSIENSKSNSFLIPRWGGVKIYNSKLPLMKHSTINKNELIPILQTFQAHVFKLFGIPNGNISSFKRINLYNHIKSTYETLGSLYKLTNQLQNINIPESTADEVKQSLKYLEIAIEKHDLEYSLKALNSANKAFFDPTMVQQAYFPSEHKLAVLLPLLGPIASIVIFSIMKLIKQRKRKID
ncbi:unnamed protein product [Candida verbasci]|uniref:GPI transamidase component GPI17 n=1 Tax=Candida verbasci TaxID=1227364 RepID=A0A9W4U159_9ASCO|nr:unnamed protein product [Candida verbasci]